MKNYLLLLSTCLIFANNQHPTQEQVDEMLNGAMQLIWQEAMQAKIQGAKQAAREKRKTKTKT